MNAKRRPSVGVVGASGYMGGELVRVLTEHPDVDLAWATSRRPGRAERDHPNLLGAGIEWIALEDAGQCDLVFLALPTDVSIPVARRFLDAGCRVVDLGAAFRLDSRADWERIHGGPHAEWGLAEEAPYGIPELHAEAIAAARIVANPGCFSSAAILGLAPFVGLDWVEAHGIVVDGLSGTAGAGADLDRALHHPEIGNDLAPYHAVDHRHSYEMEQELSRLAGDALQIHFTPVYVPVVRGILALCHVPLRREVSRAEVTQRFRAFYAQSNFVHLVEPPNEGVSAWRTEAYPRAAAVAGTNRCQIGFDLDAQRGRMVVMSALDSLGKGGAHVAVENMNAMLGLARGSGVSRLGAHPA